MHIQRITTTGIALCLVLQNICSPLVFAQEQGEEAAPPPESIQSEETVTSKNTETTTEATPTTPQEDTPTPQESPDTEATTADPPPDPTLPPTKVETNPFAGLKGLEGNFETDLFTGGGSFTYPLSVIPGRKGMQPSLSLRYSTLNTRLDSPVGYGWELDTSSIFRSSNKGTDKLYSENTFTASIFGGTEELVLVNSTTGEYRPKVEGSFRIYTFANNTWTVKDPSGVQYTFGSTAATRQTNPNNATQTFKWLLEKVVDPSGNLMTFTYTSDQNQVYPQTIRYTGNTHVANDQGIFQVAFVYEPRPDIHVNYTSAFGITTTQRLHQIDLQHNTTGSFQTAYSYQFTYDITGNRSKLAAIQLISPLAPFSLPATTFTYTNPTTAPGQPIHLLRSIQTPYGGSTTITYQPSTQYRLADGSIASPHLHLIIQTVRSVVVKNTPTDTTKTTLYDYEGGHYYYDQLDAYKREYAGFHSVTSTDAVGNVTKLFFHQSENAPDNAVSATQGEYQDHLSKKGRIYREERYDNQNHLYQSITHKWDRTDLGNERNFPFQYEQVTRQWDGTATHRDNAHVYVYDGYGNLVAERDWGEVAANEDGTYTDTGPLSEIIRHTYTYAFNYGSYIMRLPAVVTTTDGISVGGVYGQLQQTRLYYDDLPLGQSGVGNQTKQEDWLKEENRYIPTKRMAYNTTYGLPTSVTDARNYTTTTTYDSFNLYPFQVTNPKNHLTTMTYDYASGQVQELIDPNTAKTTNTYDAFGRLMETKVTDPENITAQKIIKTLVYNDTNVPFQILTTDWNGQPGDTGKTTYTYLDGFGKILQTRTVAEGTDQYSVTSKLYDAKNRLQKETLPVFETGTAYNPSPSSLASTFSYDALDRVLSITTPVGTTATTYDHWNKVVTDANNHPKKFFFDWYQNLTKVEEYNLGQTYTTQYTYDTLNRLTKIQDAENNVRGFTYDSLNRLLSQEMLHPANSSQITAYSYVYDDAGNVLVKKDPNLMDTPLSRVSVAYTYDELNRLLTEDTAITRMIDVRNEYDVGPYAKGRLDKVTTIGAERTLAYDILGRTTGVTTTLNAQPYTITTTYDLQGQPLTVTYPNNKVITYVYQNAYMVNQVKEGSNTLITNVDYNPAGSVTKLEYANGTSTTNTYDINKLYRLTEKRTLHNGNVLQLLAYNYDNVGNLLNIAEVAPTAAKRTSTYTYDDLDRLLTASITNLGGGQNVNQTFTYSPTGNILTNSLLGTYLYEQTSHATPQAVTKVGSTRTYAYDWNGNVISSTNNGVTQTLTYDYRNNLVSSQITGNSLSSFAPAELRQDRQMTEENSLQLTDDSSSLAPTEAFESSAANDSSLDPTPLDPLSGSGATLQDSNSSFVIDNSTASGSLLDSSDAISENDSSLVPMPLAPTSLMPDDPTVPTSSTTNYLYGAGFERLKKYTPNGTTSALTIYLGDYEIEGVGDIGGALQTTNLQRINLSLANGQSISLETTPATGITKTIYHHTDHLTGSSVETDQNGNILQVLDYLPFGGTRVDQQFQSYANKKKFTGKELDSESGLYYYGARYYDSDIGRWMGVDPIVLIIGKKQVFNPQELNAYSYVTNNPLKYIDPDGRTGEEVAAPLIPFLWGIAVLEPTPFGELLMAGITAVATYTVLNNPDNPPTTTVPPVEPPPVATTFPAQATDPATVTCLPETQSTSSSTTTPSYQGQTGSNTTTNTGDNGYGDTSGSCGGNMSCASSTQDKKLTPGEIERLKKAGINPHDLKKEGGSKQDLYKDQDGNITVKPKGGGTEGNDTGLNIKNY